MKNKGESTMPVTPMPTAARRVPGISDQSAMWLPQDPPRVRHWPQPHLGHYSAANLRMCLALAGLYVIFVADYVDGEDQYRAVLHKDGGIEVPLDEVTLADIAKWITHFYGFEFAAAELKCMCSIQAFKFQELEPRRSGASHLQAIS